MGCLRDEKNEGAGCKGSQAKRQRRFLNSKEHNWPPRRSHVSDGKFSFVSLMRWFVRRIGDDSFLIQQRKIIEYGLLEDNAVVGVRMIGGDVDGVDLLITQLFDGMDERIAGSGQAVVGGDNQ